MNFQTGGSPSVLGSCLISSYSVHLTSSVLTVLPDFHIFEQSEPHIGVACE